MVASAEALQHRHPPSRQHADLAGLRARVEAQCELAVERLDRPRRAERSLDDREVDGRVHVVALAHEPLVALDANADIDVAGGTAEAAGVPRARDPDALAVVDAGRDFDRQALRLHRATRARAVHARTLDQPPGAATVRAGLAAHELAEHAARHLLQPTGSAARLARARAGPGLCTVTATALAGDDVYSTVDLTIVEAAIGATRSIETLDGELALDFDAGTQAGQIRVLSGRGMPVLQGFGRGDHRVLVNVVVPRRLSDEQRAVLEEFGRLTGEENYRPDEGFFDKLKSAFR